MKKALYLTLPLVFMISASVGCHPAGAEKEISLAPIQEVRVSIAESYPPQIFVYIKGGLADSCTTFHDLKTQRFDNTINIEVTTERPKYTICLQIYGFFEQNVNLGTDFISGETYIVNVNDKTTSFVMQ
jgi:hypothetical protein